MVTPIPRMTKFKGLNNNDDPDSFNEFLADILATNYLAPLSTSYLPWSEYAMRPSGLIQVLNDILLNHRSLILECGGGISTFYIARLLKDRGGHLYTIEHNQKWLDFLQDSLQKEGIDHLVTLIYAPLTSTDLSLENTPWYNLESINKELFKEQKIDFLLVDGPPAYAEHIKYSRYPAVPYFLPLLADNFTIVIDDVNRNGEQEIVKRWQKILNLDFTIRTGDIAIAKSK
jgi:predicted O-methyltransferase YrrM